MVDKAKRTTAIARKGPENEIYSAKAAEVRPAPSSSCPLTITADEPSIRLPYVNKLLSPLKIIKGNKIYLPKRPGEPERSLADISKIKKEINWKPKISIDKGVRLMTNIISDWKDAPVWTPKKIKQATKAWFEHLSKK